MCVTYMEMMCASGCTPLQRLDPYILSVLSREAQTVLPVWANAWGFHEEGCRCGPSREETPQAPDSEVDFESGARRPSFPRLPSSLTAQPRHTHASEPRRVKRDDLHRSCSALSVRTLHALLGLAFLPSSHLPPTQHAMCTPVPLTALVAQKKTRPSSPGAVPQKAPTAPHPQRAAAGAPHSVHARTTSIAAHKVKSQASGTGSKTCQDGGGLWCRGTSRSVPTGIKIHVADSTPRSGGTGRIWDS